jgi:transcriptional regulator with XRE-family HTH domain
VPFAGDVATTDTATFLRAFGDAVRARRKARGLSQEALAADIPLYRSYFADVERGARNLGMANAQRIADALDIPLSQLVADAERLLTEEP